METTYDSRGWLAGLTSALQRAWSSIERFPLVTLTLSALAVALSLSPQASDWLTYQRTAIAAGGLWRFVTGHLVHWNAEHMLWDVMMFALLGAMIERRGRPALLGVLTLSAVAISTVMWCGQADVAQYRGLSGVDSALFTFVAATMFREARRGQRPIIAGAVAAMATGFVAKIGWELATGQTLFVDSAAAGFTPLPLVHAVGGLGGILVWFVDARLRCSGSRGNSRPWAWRTPCAEGRLRTTSYASYNEPACDA